MTTERGFGSQRPDRESGPQATPAAGRPPTGGRAMPPVPAWSPAAVLALQQSAGNAAVTRAIVARDPGGGATATAGSGDAQARIFFAAGRRAYERGDYAHALEQFNLALSLASEARRPELLYNVALAHQRLGNGSRVEEISAELLRLGRGDLLGRLQRSERQRDPHADAGDAEPGAPEDPREPARPERRPRRRGRAGGEHDVAATEAAGATAAGELEGLEAAPSVEDVNHILFNRPVTREQAVRFLWQGRMRPAMQVFRPADPEAADTAGPRLADEPEGHRRFFLDRTIPALLEALRPDVATLLPSLLAGEQGAVSVMPDWVPPDLRGATQTLAVPFDEQGVHLGRWAGASPPWGDVLAHLAHRGRTTRLDAFLEYPSSLEWYVDVAGGDQERGRLLHRTCTQANRDMWRLMREQRMPPSVALRELQAINDILLGLVVQGAVALLESGSSVMAVGAAMRTATARALERQPRPPRAPDVDDIGHADTIPGPRSADADDIAHADTIVPPGRRGTGDHLEAASLQAVDEAVARNPDVLLTSTSGEYHQSVWRANGGEGNAPVAFRIGDRYRVDIERLSPQRQVRWGIADSPETAVARPVRSGAPRFRGVEGVRAEAVDAGTIQRMEEAGLEARMRDSLDADMYVRRWREAGGQGPPPADGFVVRDPDGRLMAVVTGGAASR